MVVIIQCSAAPCVGSRITQILEVCGVPCTCWEPYIGGSSRILPHQSQPIRLVIYWGGLNEPSLHVKFQWQAYKNYRATGPRSRRIAVFWVLRVQYRMNYVHAWANMRIKASPRASNDIIRMYIGCLFTVWPVICSHGGHHSAVLHMWAVQNNPEFWVPWE